MIDLTINSEKIFTKRVQEKATEILVNQVGEGEVNPIEAVVRVKALINCLEGFLKNDTVREAVVNECGVYGKGETPSFKGAKVEIRETGVKRDFSACQDSIWCRLKAEQEAINEKLKEREKYLCVISEKKTEIDPDTGEIYEIYPAPRNSTTNYVITFPKI